MLNQLAGGKATGLNAAMSVAHGDIVVFTDARQEIERRRHPLADGEFCGS